MTFSRKWTQLNNAASFAVQPTNYHLKPSHETSESQTTAAQDLTNEQNIAVKTKTACSHAAPSDNVDMTDKPYRDTQTFVCPCDIIISDRLPPPSTNNNGIIGLRYDS